MSHRHTFTAYRLTGLFAFAYVGIAAALTPSGYPVKPPSDALHYINVTVTERTVAMYRLAASAMSTPTALAPPHFVANWKREYEASMSELLRKIRAEKISPERACVLLLERQWEAEALLRDTYKLPPME